MKAISIRRFGLLAASLGLCVGLASCGGHDDGTAPLPVAATNMPPASASANAVGFIAYLKVLVVTMPNDTQPLDLTGFVAPTDDMAPFDPSI